jgi:hypothetical protein
VTCSGLHCAGCAGGAAVPVVPLITFCGLAWVAEHLIDVAIVSAACGALSLAAVMALMKWADRRDARQAARWRLLHVREVAEIGKPITVSAPEIRHAVTDLPAIEARPEVHIHLHGVPVADQAAVIRQALNGGNTQS